MAKECCELCGKKFKRTTQSIAFWNWCLKCVRLVCGK